MTCQDAMIVEKTPSSFKRMINLGVYSVAVAVGAMGGLMALLLAA